MLKSRCDYYLETLYLVGGRTVHEGMSPSNGGSHINRAPGISNRSPEHYIFGRRGRSFQRTTLVTKSFRAPNTKAAGFKAEVWRGLGSKPKGYLAGAIRRLAENP